MSIGRVPPPVRKAPIREAPVQKPLVRPRDVPKQSMRKLVREMQGARQRMPRHQEEALVRRPIPRRLPVRLQLHTRRQHSIRLRQPTRLQQLIPLQRGMAEGRTTNFQDFFVSNSSSSGVRGQSSRNSRESARSARSFPFVWQ
jgi:hypothetical protein